MSCFEKNGKSICAQRVAGLRRASQKLKQMNKADKELEVMKWMQKQGYDRRATQEIAPIIVKYLEQHGATPAVSGSLPLLEKLKTRVENYDLPDHDAASWGREEGIVLSVNEVKQILQMFGGNDR